MGEGMIFNATLNNISDMSWWSVLRKPEAPRENHRPVASHRQTCSHKIVLSTPHHERDSKSQCLW